MPLYEYECKTCGHRFEALVYASKRPACPSCESQDLERLLSAFAVSGSASTKSGNCSMRTSSGGCSTGGT